MKSRRVRGWLLVVALLAGCGGSATTPSATIEPLVIEGTFTLHDEVGWQPETPCHGDGGYSDVAGGMRVTIRDGSAELLATSSTGAGLSGEAVPESSSSKDCTFEFSAEVPRSDFYAISIGNRGELTYSFDEMEVMDWHVAFTLGP